METSRNPRPRRGGTLLRAVLFLALFVFVLLLVVQIYLPTALTAAKSADPAERQRLGAIAWLMLAVVLFVLGSALVLSFRLGRFFFPRPTAPRTRTEYSDAWAESGRRLSVDPDDKPSGG